MSVSSHNEERNQRFDSDMSDFSDPDGDDFEALSRDKVHVRSMNESDLGTVVRIEAKLTGHGLRQFFAAKLKEMMAESGIRVSLVAEIDDAPVGYIMARVDFGEYGRTEPVAVIDSIGVNPGFGHLGVGTALLSQLLVNLDALRVEKVRTTVPWNSFQILSFLADKGFKPSQQLVLSQKL